MVSAIANFVDTSYGFAIANDRFKFCVPIQKSRKKVVANISLIVKHFQIEHQNIPVDFYICEFDIPEKLLIKGFGFYESTSGYEYYKVKIKEFILPTKLFKSSWLKKFEKDKNHSTALPEMTK